MNYQKSRLPDAINCSPQSNFTKIPNELLRDKTISHKARGILCLLLSNREGDWTSYQKTLITGHEGKTAIISGLQELEAAGYLWRVQYVDIEKKQRRGSFWAYTQTPWEYHLDEHIKRLGEEGFEVWGGSVKHLRELFDLQGEKPEPENLNIGNLNLDDQPLKRPTINKTKKINKTICSEKDSEQLNQQDDSVGVIPRKRKPPTKTITMEVPDLEEKNELYLPYVQRLAQIVFSAPGAMRSKQKTQLDAARTKQWVTEIRLLCDKDGVTTNKLTRVLDWYAEHIGGEFIPEVESASSLRKKWLKLLAAIKRSKNKPSKQSGLKPASHIQAEPGKYAGVKTITFDNTKF